MHVCFVKTGNCYGEAGYAGAHGGRCIFPALSSVHVRCFDFLVFPAGGRRLGFHWFFLLCYCVLCSVFSMVQCSH